MARKKKTPRPPRKPANRSGVSLHVYIDPAIDGALRGYVAASEPVVTLTAAVESALRAFLRGKGCWPPPAAASQKGDTP